MNLFVLGGTGRVGSQIVDVALERKHRVTALARSPQKLAARAGLRIVAGDPLDRSALERAMTGHDAVLTALGTTKLWRAMQPTMTELVSSVVAAMAASGTSRLVALSGGMLFPDPFATVLRFVLRHHARDLTRMEAVVTGTALEWTLARPPRLTIGTAESYRTASGAFPKDGVPALTCRAVAACMVDAVQQREHVREIVGVSG
jgi:putative NADH-flavin reductase